MSILFCTPCYSGLAYAHFLKSLLDTQEVMLSKGIDHDFLFTVNESLIHRARNNSVATFLESDFAYLMFIDADIEFSPNDVGKIWNLAQENPVVTAAYPMKRKDTPLSAWKDGKLLEIQHPEEASDLMWEGKIHSHMGSVTVDYCGTGFLMIHRSVFEKLKIPEIEHLNDKGPCWGFFDPVYDGEGPEKVPLSEDYAFCKRWREVGGEILLDPSIRLGHWGTYRYG